MFREFALAQWDDGAVRCPRLVPWIWVPLFLAGCRMVPPAPAPVVGSVDPALELERKVAQVRQRVELVRGVAFRAIPRVERVPADRKCAELDSARRAGWVASKLGDSLQVVDRIWKSMGIVPPEDGKKIGRSERDCHAVLALYQAKAKRILLFGDPQGDSIDRNLAHELVHALQDERFDLRRLLRSTVEPDEILGILGALEGEASFVAAMVVDPSSVSGCGGVVPGALWSLDKSIRAVPELSMIPPAVSLPAYVPYVFGERLACALHTRMGVAGLDTLLVRPPAGSAQLLSVDRYLSGRAPLDWDTSWVRFPALPSGWSALGHARIGEVRLAGLPLAWDRDLARRLLAGGATGWAGDRVWVATHPVKGEAVFWRLAFDSRKKALAFARIWWELRSIRLGRTLPAWNAASGGAIWTDSRRISYQVLVRGSQVGIGEGFDSATTARFLRATLRGLARKPD